MATRVSSGLSSFKKRKPRFTGDEPAEDDESKDEVKAPKRGKGDKDKRAVRTKEDRSRKAKAKDRPGRRPGRGPGAGTGCRRTASGTRVARVLLTGPGHPDIARLLLPWRRQSCTRLPLPFCVCIRQYACLPSYRTNDTGCILPKL